LAIVLGLAVPALQAAPAVALPAGGAVARTVYDLPGTPYPRGARVAALTFDDGPSAYTGQVLSILLAHRVPATFFEIGSQVAAHPGITRQVAADGFGLGNHSYSHPRLTALAPAALSAQIDRTTALLQQIWGRPILCVRPPYGAVDANVTQRLEARGLTVTLWSVDPSDYLRPGAGVIAQRVLSQVRPGAIVIMHDGGGDRSQTVAALPAVIAGLEAGGYRIVPICQ
jgi:peptidoglycan/xylan/chitin deacetylase (PgdA/CDA1 family)